MNFTTPQKCWDTISASDQVERVRAENRVKVNNLFGGSPPLSQEEAAEDGWLEREADEWQETVQSKLLTHV